MIKVYICDDDTIWLKKISHTIINYQVSTDWDFSVECQSTSPDDLLAYVKEQKPHSGIYFLDVDYKKPMNGMDLGKELRQLDPSAYLIYVTTHEEMAMETFRLKLMALDYIIKDSQDYRRQIVDCLHHIEYTYVTQNNLTDTLIIQNSGSKRVLLKKDILYIDAQKGTHKICIHTSEGTLAISTPLNSLQQELGKSFILCAKGCLVNVTHIVATDHSQKTLTLDNNEVCQCSIRMWKQIKEALHQ